MKLPTFSQWKQIFKVLERKERRALFLFLLVAVASLVFLASTFYFNNTNIVAANGGKYREGIVGQPRFINPIYGETNDIDRALLELTFSGLMKYDTQGKLVGDLAESYKISADGKVYEFVLKDDIFWHDGEKVTTDDIIFTIKTVQNSDYKSPLRVSWIDIEAEKVSDKTLRLTLRTPYNSFLENCTIKILPQHIWAAITPENFTLSAYNLQPVGSGPFIFKDIKQESTGFVKSISLTSNKRYYEGDPYLSQFEFIFFEKKEDLIRAANARDIDGFTLASFENSQKEAEKIIRKNWQDTENFSYYSFSMPRYFAVFFNNQKDSLFEDKNIRQGLAHATNKTELVENIHADTGNATLAVDSPILPEFYGYDPATTLYLFDTAKAKELFDKSGFKENSTGQLEKTTKKQPAYQFKAYLKVGSKGTDVTQLHSCLKRLPHNFTELLKDEADGTYSRITENAVTEFQKIYLPDAKPTGETGAGTRAKLNELCQSPTQESQVLQFTLTTINQPQLVAVANMLKSQWEKAGAMVNVEALSIIDIKPVIKERSYDALLYGEALGAEPDFYPFWHSSQKIDPGLNIAHYENKEVDQLLKDARETMDLEIKKEKYQKLQDIITTDVPALFLYNPNYVYWAGAKVQGIETEKIIDPAKRFVNVANWYLKTKRAWK